MDKSRSIPRSNCYNKSTRIEKSLKVHIHKDNLSASVLYVQGESLSSETPDTPCITRKNKRKKTPDTLIIIKQPIQAPSLRIQASQNLNSCLDS